MTRGINPITKQEEPRQVLAVLHDGLLFSASHSVLVEDVADSVKEYIGKAIARYEEDGLDATIAYYNGQGSLDGQWGLTLADENDILLVAPLGKHLIGTDLNDLATLRNRDIGREMAAAAAEGRWVNYVFPNIRSSETLYAHTWAVRHDGLLFMSRYYDDQFDVPGTP